MSEAQTAPFDESPFWRFSLRFYARSKVSAACLALQDGANVDVNLLLFLLFLAEHQRSVQAGDIARLDASISDWREQVVRRLRDLRRALKPGIGEIPGTVSETFRGQIKRLELESERIEQAVLERFSAETIGSISPSRIAAAEANFAAYEAQLARRFPPEPRAVLLSAFGEFGSHHPIA
jgi:uncharacterized protein (TIGR02444 family)